MCMKHAKLKILDCTIRDGGYLNNWKFEFNMVKQHYKEISKSGVDIIEIGFRSNSKYFDPSLFGPWRFTPEKLIDEILESNLGVPISLMVDFGKVDSEDIPEASESRVSYYRIAVHKDNVIHAIDLAQKIIQKGYKVALQLMGIVGYTDKDFLHILEPLKNSNILYVYFADSYGSLFPSDIRRYIEILKKTGKKIGFHAHNNLQLAFANTLEAIRCGIDIIDGTVYGMGRGAGNLALETMITYLEKKNTNHKFNVLPIINQIDSYFIEMKKQYPWGYQLQYMLSGIYEVHSNYSKTLVEWREYTMEDIKICLQLINKINPIGFDKNLLERIIKSGFIGRNNVSDKNHLAKNFDKESIDINTENVDYKNRHINKDFLILANGHSLKTYKDEIKEFIKKYEPVTIGSNFLDDLFIPDYHSFSNKKRFIDYVKTVNAQSTLLLSSMFSKDFIKENTEKDYEIIRHSPKLSTDFNISDGIIMNSCRTISILSIAVAIVMGAKKIYIVGLDGYKNVDIFIGNNIHFYPEPDETENFGMLMEKHNWNELLLGEIDNYLLKNKLHELTILTPTSHKSFFHNIDYYLDRK